MVQAPAVGTAPRDPDDALLPTATYARSVALVVAATLAFRVALGARASFTGDDFTFRAAMAGAFSPGKILAGHNGHLNPLGLTLQWILQHAFPGRFVPLMVLSALLVACSQILAALWVAEVFAPRWLGVAAAAVTGLSPMLLELATWWSVALYAAPMVATAWLMVLMTTRYLLHRARLWMVLGAYALCLASSTKAVLIPVLLIGIAAGIGIGRPIPLGFRRALSSYRRLWIWITAMLIVYTGIFLINRGPITTASPTPGDVTTFILTLLKVAALPAVWGGPWGWFSLGSHAAPAPPAWAAGLSALGTVLALVCLLMLRPRTWRIALATAVYLTMSSAFVAVGRAGSPWGAAVLRYTFDLLLPVVLVMCAGLADSRWEAPTGSRWLLRLRGWAGWRPLAVAAGVAWTVSLGLSYALPWSILPNAPMKQWVQTARTAYPQLPDGLLQQWAPRAVALFPEDLDLFLAGDPGKPPEVQYVMDRVLGFDDQGRLVIRDVAGPSSIAAAPCTYQATKIQPAVIPLETGLLRGRHTVAVDYRLSIDSTAELTVGDSNPVRMFLPAGERRVYAVAEGQGDTVTITVGDPNATMCILSAQAGGLEDRALVGPAPR